MMPRMGTTGFNENKRPNVMTTQAPANNGRPAGYMPSNPPPAPGINPMGGMNVLTPPTPGTPAASAPWSFQLPDYNSLMSQYQGQMQQVRPQAPAPAPMPAPVQQQPRPATPQGPSLSNQLMDPAPYNRAVDRGNQMIGSIPTNASPLTSFSPAFKGLSGNLQSALGGQWQNLGQGARDESGLEFARKAGTEIPAFQLAQMLGLRGLENDYADLGNQQYGNNIARTTGGLNSMLQLLGSLGSFF
jgi:hypothetical protein